MFPDCIGMNCLWRITVVFIIVCDIMAVEIKTYIFQVTYDTKLTVDSNEIIIIPDSSRIRCAFQCTVRPTCCRANYDETSRECQLDNRGNCCAAAPTETASDMNVISLIGSGITSSKPTDCGELPTGSCSGVYTIYPGTSTGFQVYCEIEASGGNWAVLQRRQDGSEDFYRTWEEYRTGFGDLNGEFWLGNDNIHIMSSQGSYTLRIDMEDWNGDKRYAVYDSFVVGSQATDYTLTLSGYSGDAGDSMLNTSNPNHSSNNMKFSTHDRDNDNDGSNSCAFGRHGGYWYNYCGDSNLNGKCQQGVTSWHSMDWYTFKGHQYALKTSQMMIRKS